MSANRRGRGSSRHARLLRQWLLDTFGDGVAVMCWRRHPGCAGLLTIDTLTLDRWPLAGGDGGAYRQGNIIPACSSCNLVEGRLYVERNGQDHGQRRTPAQAAARARYKKRKKMRRRGEL